MSTKATKTKATKTETTTAVEETTTAVEETTTAVEKSNESETFSGTITNVLFNEDSDRLTITTNVSFTTRNMKSGEEAETNSFGIHILNFVNQTKQFCELLEIADSFNVSVNDIINPQIIKLLFVGANIEFTRTFVEKGMEREHDGIYSNDTFITKIVKVSTNVSALKQNMAFQLLQQKPTIPSRKARMTATAAQSLNPFNI